MSLDDDGRRGSKRGGRRRRRERRPRRSASEQPPAAAAPAPANDAIGGSTSMIGQQQPTIAAAAEASSGSHRVTVDTNEPQPSQHLSAGVPNDVADGYDDGRHRTTSLASATESHTRRASALRQAASAQHGATPPLPHVAHASPPMSSRSASQRQPPTDPAVDLANSGGTLHSSDRRKSSSAGRGTGGHVSVHGTATDGRKAAGGSGIATPMTLLGSAASNTGLPKFSAPSARATDPAVENWLSDVIDETIAAAAAVGADEHPRPRASYRPERVESPDLEPCEPGCQCRPAPTDNDGSSRRASAMRTRSELLVNPLAGFR
eukprot:CAMPEP_0174847826 /NCGR_PEP_ID=MMETSP1114-20130205/13152_1 /TAXON_ID=312471 /ORGANISM="Neobodo designis, Strain CCAP 1951/1" /LENGTH=319 /DNA_ID=CAMNT_0016082113 /DNA_START=170 /DNA_END=1129 /DNA_ORIENTATION=-